jgi:choice-of-anchor C domain-containing protein
MDRAKWSGAVLISSVSFLLTVGLAQSVFINRSFEDGKDPGDAMVVPPGSAAIDGWTVVGGNVLYVGRKWQPSQGLRSVGLPCGGGISQTLETDPDQKYEVRFSMAGDPNAGPATKSVTVSFGASSRVFTFDTTGHSLTEMGWDSRTWIFAATGTTTTLTFLSPKTECSTPAVDNVRIAPTDSAVRAHPIDAPVPGHEASPHGDSFGQ